MSITFGIVGVTDMSLEEELVYSLSNANASEILVLLGLPIGSAMGSMNARQFRQRIELVLATEDFDDSARASESSHDGRYHYGGRREGYISEKLRLLQDLCLQAGDLGTVWWG